MPFGYNEQQTQAWTRASPIMHHDRDAPPISVEHRLQKISKLLFSHLLPRRRKDFRRELPGMHLLDAIALSLKSSGLAENKI